MDDFFDNFDVSKSEYSNEQFLSNLNDYSKNNIVLKNDFTKT